MALKIGKSHLEEIRKHGEETYPHECCGVLMGKSAGGAAKTVLAVVRCGNTRTDSPWSRYHIDPRELVRIQRESQLAGRAIVGFYHSHPDHPAQWSATDLAEAYWVQCSYVITSVEQGRAVSTRSFVLHGEEDTKRFEDEDIQVDASGG